MLKKSLVATALIGLLITPIVWSGTTMFNAMSGTFPSAGLSLISSSKNGASNMGMGSTSSSSSSKLIEFLTKNKTTEKYILVTSSTNGNATDIILNTNESVMTWGFFGTDKVITLADFKVLVKNGEVRYVMIGGQGGGSTDEIMTWAKSAGKLVVESEWKDTTLSSDSKIQQPGGGGSEVLYDLKGADTTK